MMQDKPTLDYATGLPTPPVPATTLKGANIVIAVGLAMVGVGIYMPFLTRSTDADVTVFGIGLIVFGGIAVLAGFKQHVIDVVAVLHRSRERSHTNDDTKKPQA